MRKAVFYLVVGLLSLGLLSTYRARLDNLPFFVSFDKLAKTIVNETWRVISAPTVFLAVILALILIAYRRQLSPLLPTVSELTIGRFSARFLTRQAIEETVATPPERPQSAADSTKREIATNLSEKLCIYLLRVANRPLPLEEHLRLIGQEALGRKAETVAEVPPLLGSLMQGIRTYEASGYLRALYEFLGLIGSVEFTGRGAALLIRIDSPVLDLIRQRVGKEPDQEEKQSKAPQS